LRFRPLWTSVARTQAEVELPRMFFGFGTIVLIVIIVLIFLFLRRH
jgi:hypothetical protein